MGQGGRALARRGLTVQLAHDLGDGVALRMFAPEDAEELFALVDAHRDHLSPWHAFAAEDTLLDTRAYLHEILTRYADGDGLNTAVVRDGRIVGNVGTAQPVDWDARAVELGYWLAPGEQGRGTMTRAVRAHVDHAFGVWRLGRVQILCAVHNERSRAIPERLGFTHEGTLRHAERIGDRVHDLAVYAMLAGDWESGSGGSS